MFDTRESLVKELVTLRDFVRWGASAFNRAELFFGHGTDNAWDDAVQIVLHALSLPMESGAMVLDARLTAEERAHVASLLFQRIEERIPTPYLLGHAWFCGMKFKVDERVLIPRSPIAEVIEAAFQPWVNDDPKAILDLCTGSGCIGIACAETFPNSEVDLVDISTDALEIAQENIDEYHLGHRVTAIASDLFTNLEGKRYDIIVTNPPYVDAEDMSDLPEEFRHEPELALAAGFDGLDIVRKLLVQAPDYLSDDGILVCELGNSWVHLQDAYPEVPFTWMEFERGGHGVFLITMKELLEYKDSFSGK